MPNIPPGGPASVSSLPATPSSGSAALPVPLSGGDNVRITPAEGLQGALGLYAVESDGQTRLMSRQDIENTRFAQCNASPPPPLPPDEQFQKTMGGDAALHSYQQAKALGAEVHRELAEAHRTYQATGRIPQTRIPFSFAEIKAGRTMSVAERYDAMLRQHGVDHAVFADAEGGSPDPEFLTADEFKREVHAREHAEWQKCDDDNIRPGTIDRCQRAVDEKYGGQAFTQWRDAVEQATGAQVRSVQARIDNVANSGAVATLGRLFGGVAAAVSGHDVLSWSEHGAAIGNLGDAGLAVRAGKVEMDRARAYDGGGGLNGRGSQQVVGQREAVIDHGDTAPRVAEPAAPAPPSPAQVRVQITERAESVVAQANAAVDRAVRAGDAAYFQGLGMSPSQVAKVLNPTSRLFKAEYGNAIEDAVARGFAQDPVLSGVIQHIGNQRGHVAGTGKPDFVVSEQAWGSKLFLDVTTEGKRAAHIERDYGKRVMQLTYSIGTFP